MNGCIRIIILEVYSYLAPFFSGVRYHIPKQYYQNNVKPKPETEGKKGWVCKICGYVYEGEELPDDFICPLCKHGAADFEPIG